MKALVLEEYNKLVYKNFPDPEVAGDEVLVQVKAVGICGSDVHGMDGSSGRMETLRSWEMGGPASQSSAH